MRDDPRARVPDADFIRLFETIGPVETARRLNVSKRNVFSRRKTIEAMLGRTLDAPGPTRHLPSVHHPHRIQLDIRNGTVLIGSDAHIWPGAPSLAMRAFTRFCRDMKPTAVILNGDVLDFPRISRHPPIGWESQPQVADEIEAAKEQLHQIESATFKARKIWTLGNHDARYETRLATVAPEYARVHGVHLRDSFPLWEPCWSVFINDNVVVKHRFKSGVHAPHNNAMWSGRTMVTGHLHSSKVQPLTDYNGTRYGVDTGCLADTDAKAFIDYTEDNPKSWRSGFCVLTFVDGQLLPPELVSVWDDSRVVFRGQLIEVSHETKAASAPRSVAKASAAKVRRGRGRVERLRRSRRAG